MLPTPKDDRQIQYVFNHPNALRKFEDAIVYSRFRNDILTNQLIKFIQTKLQAGITSDTQLYPIIRKYVHDVLYQSPEYQQLEATRLCKEEQGSGRSSRRVKDFRPLFNKNQPPKLDKYLDIGSSHGSITAEIGEFLVAKGLPPTEIYAVDVYDADTPPSVNFVKLENPHKLPFEDSSFSVVTAYMVLHHVIDQQAMIKEIYRVLQPNGVLVISEHDSSSALQVNLDLIHGFYAMVYNDTLEMEDFKTHYAKYHSMIKWYHLITKEGFTTQSRPRSGGPWKKYTQIFIKN